MSKRDLRKKIAELQRAKQAAVGGEERAIRRRLCMAHLDERVNLIAPRFQRAKDPKDRTLPPEAEELWGEDYTAEQLSEEIERRVLDKFDEYMARPMGNTGALTPYTKDLTPEDKARLYQEAILSMKAMAAQIKRERDKGENLSPLKGGGS
jgi:hypothetical protein